MSRKSCKSKRQPYGRRQKLTALGLAAGILMTGVASSARESIVAETDAAFTASGYGQAPVSSGTVAPVGILTCSSGLAQNPTLHWTAPTTGLAVSGYEIRISRASAPDTVIATRPLDSSARSFTLGPSLLELGRSYIVRIVVVHESGWTSTTRSVEARRFSLVGIPLTSSCTVLSP